MNVLGTNRSALKEVLKKALQAEGKHYQIEARVYRKK